jgi:hypothetical protein
MVDIALLQIGGPLMDRSLWSRLGILILAVCMAMVVWQPAPAQAARKKILKIAAKEPDTLDPHSRACLQTLTTSRSQQ